MHFFTDGSKYDENVAAAAVCENINSASQVPDQCHQCPLLKFMQSPVL